MFVVAELSFEQAVEELDVAFGERVGSWWFVGAFAPEGWFFFLEWWQERVETDLFGKSVL